ncbi:MAG: hypothetical protein LBE99_01210 [Puniceicoccales bacterium]|jgi:hypothetical protein|nr:hypothetical protein [Puniceicoccales bacterium]
MASPIGSSPLSSISESNPSSTTIGKDAAGRSITQNPKQNSGIKERIKLFGGLARPSMNQSSETHPKIVTKSPKINQAASTFGPKIEAEKTQKELSKEIGTHTSLLNAAQNEYNKSSWVGKIGLKIQSHWKTSNAYARKIDYQDKLTQDIEKHAFQKSMGAEAFWKDNQTTIQGWLKGVEQCSPRRQPELIKLILSKVIQTGNPQDLTPIKNFARQHFENKIDPYYYAQPQEQLQMIQELTSKIQNATSRSEKSRLKNEFVEKLKGTLVKDQTTVNTLAKFIGKCSSKARPALLKAVHEQLQSCGADANLARSLNELSGGLKSLS